MSEAAAAMAAASPSANGTPGKGDQAKKKSDKVSMVNVASIGTIEIQEMDSFYFYNQLTASNRNPGNGSMLSVLILLFWSCMRRAEFIGSRVSKYEPQGVRCL